jgi:hypothetical protein
MHPKLGRRLARLFQCWRRDVGWGRQLPSLARRGVSREGTGSGCGVSIKAPDLAHGHTNLCGGENGVSSRSNQVGPLPAYQLPGSGPFGPYGPYLSLLRIISPFGLRLWSVWTMWTDRWLLWKVCNGSSLTGRPLPANEWITFQRLHEYRSLAPMWNRSLGSGVAPEDPLPLHQPLLIHCRRRDEFELHARP